MTYTKIYKAKTQIKRIYNELNKNSRNKRRYVRSLAPGRKAEYSVPLEYLKKYFSRSLDGEVLVNNKKVKIKNYPVCLLDFLSVNHENQSKNYVFMMKNEPGVSCRYILTEVSENPNLYHVLSYKVRKDHYLVSTFQNKLFKVSKEEIHMLQKFGSYILFTDNVVKIRSLLEDYKYCTLIKLSGVEKFKHYEILKIEKVDKYHYKIVLEDTQGKRKETILNTKDLNQKYTFYLKKDVFLK